MEAAFHYLSRAIGSLRRAPLFAALAMSLLTATAVAVGLGLTVIDVAFMRPVPYAEPEMLAVIMGAANEDCDLACPDLLPREQYHQLRPQIRSFEILAPFEWRDFLVGGPNEASHLAGAVVDAQFFQLLGVDPQLGRALQSTDDAPESPPVVVLSDGLWRRAFGTDPKVVGKVISLAGRLVTVVGVMPSEFRFPTGASLWVPESAVPSGLSSGSRFVASLGRLRRGTTLDQARAELKVLARRSHASTIITSLRTSISAHPFADDTRAGSPYLTLVLGAVGLLLLVAFAALQTLAIVRALGQRSAMAVRAAVGASRLQLLCTALAESVVITGLSLVAAFVVLAWLLSSSPLWLPATVIEASLSIRGMVFAAVALGMVLFAGLAFVPATAFIVQATTSSILRTVSGTSSPPRQATALRMLAVGIQIGLGVVFLTVAATLGRAIVNLRGADLGYDRRNLIVAPLDLRDTPFDQTDHGQGFAQELAAKLGASPGVSAATVWSVSAPSMMVQPGEPFATIEGGIKELRYGCRHPSDCSFPMLRYGVTEAFFQATGVRILIGRAFNVADQWGTAPVAIISKQAAVHWWLGESPLGRRFKLGPASSPYPWLTVVGVAANTQPIDEWGILHGATHPGQFYPLIFQPLSQVNLGPSGRPAWTASLLVGIRRTETALNPRATIRAAIQELAPTVAIGRVASMQEVQSSIILFDQIRLGAWAASIACAIATALTLLSIGGLVAEGIRARIREFGIRLAVGATPARLRRTATKDALRLTLTAVLSAGAAGLVLRYPLAKVFYGATERYRDGILYGTTPHLVPTLLVAAAILGVVACGCAWVASRPLQQLNAAMLLRQD